MPTTANRKHPPQADSKRIRSKSPGASSGFNLAPAATRFPAPAWFTFPVSFQAQVPIFQVCRFCEVRTGASSLVIESIRRRNACFWKVFNGSIFANLSRASRDVVIGYCWPNPCERTLSKAGSAINCIAGQINTPIAEKTPNRRIGARSLYQSDTRRSPWLLSPIPAGAPRAARHSLLRARQAEAIGG